ncbi:MAG: hypothetical protein P8Z31_07295, partial [Gammaproteobacteria bacterium]
MQLSQAMVSVVQDGAECICYTLLTAFYQFRIHIPKERSMRNLMASLLFITSLAGPASFAHADDAADRIWFGGPVITMNDAAMRAEAVAEK